ncbi:MAG: serine/threonine-protein kinase [Planctomycetota bacterium]
MNEDFESPKQDSELDTSYLLEEYLNSIEFQRSDMSSHWRSEHNEKCGNLEAELAVLDVLNNIRHEVDDGVAFTSLECTKCRQAFVSTVESSTICETCSPRQLDKDQWRVDEIASYMPDDFSDFQYIGGGGFGSVFSAFQESLGRRVAIKILRKNLVSNPKNRKRFIQEARNAAILNDPRIVKVFETGSTDRFPFIVSDLIVGETFSEKLGNRSLTLKQKIDLLRQTAIGLQHAHASGVIHRDIKPSNILLHQRTFKKDEVAHSTRDRKRSGFELQVCIADFGLSAAEFDENRVTSTGEIIGTLEYMSPEQAKGFNKQIDERSDIFAMGVILYEILTGSLPFQGNRLKVQYEIINTKPPAAHIVNPACPLDLSVICEKALCKEPEWRFQSAQELADELDRYLNDAPVVSRPLNKIENARRWCKRKPMAAAAISLLVGLLTVSVVSAYLLNNLYNQSQNRLAKSNINLRHGIDSITTFVASLEDPLSALSDHEQRELASKLKEKSEAILIDNGDSLLATAMNAKVQVLLAKLERLMGNDSDSLARLNNAKITIQSLQQRKPKEIDYWYQFSTISRELASVEKYLGKSDAAERYLQEAISQSGAFEEFHDDDRFLATISKLNAELGEIYDLKDDEPNSKICKKLAIEYLLQVNSREPSHLYQLVDAHIQTAEELRVENKIAAARKSFDEALSILDNDLEEFQQSSRFKRAKGKLYNYLGLFYLKHSNLSKKEACKKAREQWEKSWAFRSDLAARLPFRPDIQSEATKVANNLIFINDKLGESEQANSWFGKGQLLRRQLVQTFPDRKKYQLDLAAMLYTGAKSRIDAGHSDEAIVLLDESIELFVTVSDTTDLDAKAIRKLGYAYSARAEAHQAKKELNLALSDWKEAVRYTNNEFKEVFGICQARIMAELGQPTEAASLLEAFIPKVRLEAALHNAVEAYIFCAEQRRSSSSSEADEYLEKAVETMKLITTDEDMKFLFEDKEIEAALGELETYQILKEKWLIRHSTESND